LVSYAFTQCFLIDAADFFIYAEGMNISAPYSTVTRQIRVSVRPTYLDEQSAPADNHFVWAYHVKIENLGSETVQLVGRHWRITDAHGVLHEVKGQGVVGEQPTLEPGDFFQYTSGTPLASPSGIMSGTYQMTNERGESFDVEIPAFSLDSPYQPVRLN
jgi:ApaG protein